MVEGQSPLSKSRTLSRHLVERGRWTTPEVQVVSSVADTNVGSITLLWSSLFDQRSPRSPRPTRCSGRTWMSRRSSKRQTWTRRRDLCVGPVSKETHWAAFVEINGVDTVLKQEICHLKDWGAWHVPSNSPVSSAIFCLQGLFGYLPSTMSIALLEIATHIVSWHSNHHCFMSFYYLLNSNCFTKDFTPRN